MNLNIDQCAITDADQWHRARLSRSLRCFVPLMPLSTFAGCVAIVLHLWPVMPVGLLAGWFYAGLMLIAVLWAVGYFVYRAHDRGPARSTDRCRRSLVAASLVAGLFWGVTSIVLQPVESPLHQAALALTIAAVTSLWLPLFVIERITALTHAVPALLPMALNLLLPPTAMPLATMGSLLLIVLAALIVAAHMIRKMFDADDAAHRALYHLATHDSLVGLVNHAEFDRRVMLLESAGSGPYAIVFIDLDDFKRVNDTAGHRQGDRLLREVGAILRDEKRKLDVAARVGGDEFALLMELCSDYEALRVARAVSRRIAALSSTPGMGGLRVTASIGIACSVADAGRAPGIVDAADRACYAAKRAGRNRIELASRFDAGPGATAGSVHAPAPAPRHKHAADARSMAGAPMA